MEVIIIIQLFSEFNSTLFSPYPPPPTPLLSTDCTLYVLALDVRAYWMLYVLALENST